MKGRLETIPPSAPYPAKGLKRLGNRYCPSLVRRIWRHNSEGTIKRCARATKKAIDTVKSWLKHGVPRSRVPDLLAGIEAERANIRAHLAELDDIEAALRSEIE